jgi:hypothetical protein
MILKADVINVKIFSLKSWTKNGHSSYFGRKRDHNFFWRKLVRIADYCDHNIDHKFITSLRFVCM